MIKKYNIYLFKNEELEKEYKEIKTIDKDGKIIFKIDDIKTTINKDEIIRENNEYKFYLNIPKKNSYYILKSHNLSYDITVEKAQIKRINNEIIINYKIETNDEEITIKIVERM